MVEQRSENTTGAKFLRDIDALNPPKIAVAPIAPFISDEQLPGHDSFALLFGFGQEVGPFGRMTQQSGDSSLHSRIVQPALLGFPSHAQVEVSDKGGIRQCSGSNRNRAKLADAGALFKKAITPGN